MESRIIPSQYISVPSQARYIQVRRDAKLGEAIVCGELFLILPGVFDTSMDTELMAETVRVKSVDSFWRHKSTGGSRELLCGY